MSSTPPAGACAIISEIVSNEPPPSAQYTRTQGKHQFIGYFAEEAAWEHDLKRLELGYEDGGYGCSWDRSSKSRC